MQKKLDYIDNIIKASAIEVQVSDNYNERLLEKLNKKKKQRSKFWFLSNRPAAASFILSGIIIGVLEINIVGYNLSNLEGKFKFQAAIYQYEYQYKIDAFKNEIGEWF
jgi:hypothetical protein